MLAFFSLIYPGDRNKHLQVSTGNCVPFTAAPLAPVYCLQIAQSSFVHLSTRTRKTRGAWRAVPALRLPVAELASHFQSSSILKDIPFQVLTKDRATSVPSVLENALKSLKTSFLAYLVYILQKPFTFPVPHLFFEPPGTVVKTLISVKILLSYCKDQSSSFK